MENINVNDLKPCPFCGCGHIRISYCIDSENPFIECDACGIEVRYADCIRSAMTLWNNREGDGRTASVLNIDDAMRYDWRVAGKEK